MEILNNMQESNKDCSFKIEFTKENTTVDFLEVGRTEKNVRGDILFQDALLEFKRERKKIKGGSFLKINGVASLPIAYLLSHELCHLYRVVTVYYPQQGGEKENRYIVVNSFTQEYQIGDILEFNGLQVEKVVSVVPNSATESTFHLSLDGDTLYISKKRAEGNQIVADIAARIEEKINSKELRGGKFIKINGNMTVAGCYVIASHLAHLYATIAVFDPKLGSPGIDRYIVSIQHGSKHQIGSVLEYNVPETSTVKVALCAYPKTGKSCLREALNSAIENIPELPNNFHYCIEANPDNRKSPCLRTYPRYPEIAEKIRKQGRKEHSEELADYIAETIKNIQNSLLIFDIGGAITNNNEKIIREATHVIILIKKDELAEENKQMWKDFCQLIDVPVVAIIYSDYFDYSNEIIQEHSNYLEGTVYPLNYNFDASSLPVIKKLAELLVNLAKKKSIHYHNYVITVQPDFTYQLGDISKKRFTNNCSHQK
jgi:CRISPR-associated protein Csx3